LIGLLVDWPYNVNISQTIKEEKMIKENLIRMYGTKWCPDCVRAKQVFQKKKASFVWVDIETDQEASDLVEKINKGYKSVPTIVFTDGSVLVEPGSRELEKKLADAGYA
jgi:mycoredoxin